MPLNLLKFLLLVFCVEWAFVFAAPPAARPVKVINQTLVQVGATVITERDVQLAGLIEDWLLFRDVLTRTGKKSKRKVEILAAQSEGFQKKLQEVVVETLFFLEATQFNVAEVNAKKVTKSVADFLSDLKNSKEFQSMNFAEYEITQGFERAFKASDFIDFLTRSSPAEISPAEIQNYYQANRVRFGQFPLSDFRDTIHEYLKQQAQEEKVRDRLDGLRKKHKVRFLKSEVEGKSGS